MAPFLHQDNVSAQIVGLLLLVITLAYAVANIVGALIMKKIKDSTKFNLMVYGLVILCIGLITLGPSNLLPLERNYTLLIISLILIGFSVGIIFLPSFECIYLVALQNGFDDSTKTHGLVSGLWTTASSLG